MIITQPFGRTGHDSTRTLFGAAALSRVTQDEADRTLEVLLEYGVNHIDTAASYGEAELRLGPWMKEHRDKFFLATKTGERSYQAARDEIHRSLEKLRVDQVDLLQLHHLVNPQEWEEAMGAGGALEAAIEARQEGLVRFIGVTGHGTTVAAMHKQSLERFDFDSVLLPVNYSMMQNARYAADFENLLTLCQQRNVAVQTIKSMARGGWHGQPQRHATWYEPFEEQTEIERAIHWVLARPSLFLNTVGDIHLLPHVLEAASRFDSTLTQVQADAQMAEIEMTPLFVS